MPDMPPVDGASHLIGYLFEVGPTLSGSMGEGPLTNLELRAWQEAGGFELQPWESRFLLRLSREYLMQGHLAEKANCEAPWMPQDFAPEYLRAASDSLRQSIRNLANL